MSIPLAIGIFAVGAVVIALVGSRLTRLADRLADRTGLGEAFIGATFLGAVTSLPGITASVVAAIDGRPQMALANAIGGIAAQTAFLAIADLVYRRANLEHAAASVANLLQAVVLVLLLALMIIAIATPAFSIFAVHPVTFVLPLVYFGGMKLVQGAKDHPMWKPIQTEATIPDEPDENKTDTSADWSLWGRFAIAAVIVMAAGYAVTKAVQAMTDQWGWMNQSIAGALFTAVATSLPELVTSIAAVRRGALTLAVGGIIGGNCFDTLFAAVADIAYRDGSLYHAVGGPNGLLSRELMLIAAAIAMTALVLLGLLRRQRFGPIKIGFESVLVLGLYGATLLMTSVF